MSIRAVGALTVSLALVAPTLVLSANGQAIARTTTYPIWAVFCLGAACIALIAYSIERLASSLGAGSSAHHIIVMTLGSRAGRAVGGILCSAYFCFAIATPSATVAFATDLAGQDTPVSPRIWSLGAAAIVLLAMLWLRWGHAWVTRVLLMIEGGGIFLLVLIASAVMTAGPEPGTIHAVMPHDAGISGLFSGIVVAFLSWAGFESCLSVTTGTPLSRRDIQSSLYGCVLTTAILFAVVSWAIQKGFNMKLGGTAALAHSQNALGAVGGVYLGNWSTIAFGIAAVASSFAGLIAAMTAASHLLVSLFPTILAHNIRATTLVGAIVLLMQFFIPRLYLADASPITIYGLLASCGAICIMLAYQAVQIGFARAIISTLIKGNVLELVIAATAFCAIGLILYTSLEQPGTGREATIASLLWCVGIMVACMAGKASGTDPLPGKDEI